MRTLRSVSIVLRWSSIQKAWTELNEGFNKKDQNENYFQYL